MKKKKSGLKLSRGQGARRALYRSLIKAFVENGRMETTRAKAKFIQKRIDKLVNAAKKSGVSARRMVFAQTGNDRGTVDKIFNEVVGAFANRSGGYTRIINLGKRLGDNAEMVRLEWVADVATGGKKEVRKKTRSSTDKGETTKGIRGIRGRLTRRAIKKSEATRPKGPDKK